MAWEVERHGRRSTVIGAAHFFPRHFRASLRRLIGASRVAVFEGPLDEAATRKVLEAGRGSGGAELYQSNREAIHARLGIFSAPFDVHQLLKDLVFGRQEDLLAKELAALKPWAAFFGIWTRYRERLGWTHSVDLDARRIAADLGREIRTLETIEEQIAALEAVPVGRFRRFLSQEDWAAYCERYERHYLAGDLEKLVAAARGFPTYCAPIIEERDPRLVERMMGDLERGDACVVIGVAHCPGVLAQLAQKGFSSTPL
jgi:hypothetical protein